MPQQRLTDRVIAPYITGDTLIHIVNTGDTIQYSGGSSYKATIDQVATYISENYTMFSGGSGSCITDLYVSNLYGCSPINVNDETIFNQNLTAQTITITSGEKIVSSNGDATLDLSDQYGPNGTWSITSDNGGYGAGSTWIYGQPNNGAQLSYQKDISEAIGIGIYYSGVSEPLLNTAKEIVIIDNTSGSTKNSGDMDKRAIFIGTRNSTFNTNVTNSVVIGGVGLSATQDDTVYIDNLNINTIGGGTPIFNLGLDSSGNVVTGVTSSFTGGTVPGETIFSSGLSATTISATTIGSPTDCVDDLYVSNIHSCSPLNINPLDEGNVYFGSTSAVTIDLTNNRVGIGVTTPSEILDISGKTKTINFQMTSGATSGYVLTSDGSGNASWGSLYNKSTINISSPTILGTLSSGGPVQLVPAPSLGKYYDWHAFVRYTYGTIPYNNSAGGYWYIEQGGANLSYGFNLNAITTNRTWKATEGSGGGELIGPSGFETGAINIRLNAPTTSGNGVISVDIYYRELDL